jgi:hypothetical protein
MATFRLGTRSPVRFLGIVGCGGVRVASRSMLSFGSGDRRVWDPAGASLRDAGRSEAALEVLEGLEIRAALSAWFRREWES